MGDLSDSLVRFWMPGLNRLSARPVLTLHEWILAGKFQIYSPISTDRFEITPTNVDDLVEAFGADCNRFSSAALESIATISDSSTQAKATAWIIVRAYYSSYYAANALLRIFGQSTSQF